MRVICFGDCFRFLTEVKDQITTLIIVGKTPKKGQAFLKDHWITGERSINDEGSVTIVVYGTGVVHKPCVVYGTVEVEVPVVDGTGVVDGTAKLVVNGATKVLN